MIPIILKYLFRVFTILVIVYILKMIIQLVTRPSKSTPKSLPTSEAEWLEDADILVKLDKEARHDKKS